MDIDGSLSTYLHRLNDVFFTRIVSCIHNTDNIFMLVLHKRYSCPKNTLATSSSITWMANIIAMSWSNQQIPQGA